VGYTHIKISCHRNGSKTMKIHNLKNVFEYIEEHIHEKISLQAVSQVAGYSSPYFSRLFKKQTGMSISDYIRRRKLQYSMKELEAGSKVVDIAVRYGFDTHEGYARSFGKVYGSAPHAVQKYIASYGLKEEWKIDERAEESGEVWIQDKKAEKKGEEKMINKRLEEKKITEILWIPYSHQDHAYMNTRRWHKRRYVKILCEVLDVMKEDPDFTWHIDNIAHTWEAFEKYCPERVEEFCQCVKKGRICILNGGFGLDRPERGDEETFVRNMMAGKRRFQKVFGLEEIPGFFNADTEWGHSQLPQLLTLAGHKYYRAGRPEVFLNKKGVPMQFWWEGLDGTRILTTREKYDGFSGLTEWLNLDADTCWEEKKQHFFERELSRRLPDCACSDLVIGTVGADDTRPHHEFWKDEPINLDGFMKEWNQREKVKMHYATLDEACRMLEERDLPVWKGAIDHAGLGYMYPAKGVQSQNRWLHELDQLIPEVEKLSVIAESLGLPYPEEKITALWEKQNRIGGHAIEGLCVEDFKEIEWIAKEALYTAKSMRSQIRDYIVNAVKGGDHQRIVAINTMNWECEQAVRFQVTEYDGLRGFDVVDAAGRKLTYQVTDYFQDVRDYPTEETRGVEIETVVKVPAMGYTVLHIVPNRESLKEKIYAEYIEHYSFMMPEDAPNQVTFDNGLLEVSFEKGKVISLCEKESGKKICAEGSEDILGVRLEQLEPSEFDMANSNKIINCWDFIPERGKVLEKGPISYVYTAMGRLGDEEAVVTYTLKAGARALDICVETNFNKGMDGVLWFYARADKDCQVHADFAYGAEKREYYHDLAVDSITGEEVCDWPEWASAGQTYGRTWCNYTCNEMSVALVRKTNHWRYDYHRKEGRMYAALSGMWDMKAKVHCFRQCNDTWALTGRQYFELSLFFTKQQGHYIDLQKYSRLRQSPAYAEQQMIYAGSGFAPETVSILDVDQENVICTAVYKEKGRHLARFFECQGEAVDAVISLPESVSSVRAVDLDGKELADVNLEMLTGQNAVKVSFGAWKIITLEWI